MQWATQHVYAILVSRVAGLWYDGNWMERALCQTFASDIVRHEETCAEKVGKGGQKSLKVHVTVVDCN